MLIVKIILESSEESMRSLDIDRTPCGQRSIECKPTNYRVQLNLANRSPKADTQTQLVNWQKRKQETSIRIKQQPTGIQLQYASKYRTGQSRSH
ncbi:hypothetical protein T4E_3034 [Trichinella pseudospiralis]|uniref:Uncharacterized protein n=1 Tax=Trichinella pseudospiralis TaxID=6337 RepID=A0A0V0XFN5_TRIPS|nr:hypothetical protein T4E_3034 [Trichinella pseudospiralis]